MAQQAKVVIGAAVVGLVAGIGMVVFWPEKKAETWHPVAKTDTVYVERKVPVPGPIQTVLKPQVIYIYRTPDKPLADSIRRTPVIVGEKLNGHTLEITTIDSAGKGMVRKLNLPPIGSIAINSQGIVGYDSVAVAKALSRARKRQRIKKALTWVGGAGLFVAGALLGRR